MQDQSASPPVMTAPQTEGHAVAPAHLYGTRAALFYLLRETGEPPTFAQAHQAAAPEASLTVVASPGPAKATPPVPSAQILQMLPESARPVRSAVHDMLMSDSFDFRGIGDLS
jgi:hypothetical protein